MPIRGIQDYKSSGEATEEYFNSPDDGNQLLTRNEILDLTTNPEDIDSIHFVPQVTDPLEEEGRFWYDDEYKTFAFFSDVPGVQMRLGDRLVLRVYNNTGTTIVRGRSCRTIGVHTDQTPTIQMSIADTYENSHVDGITTADILSGGYGFITTFGISTGYDLSPFAIGDTIYLSDIEAGRGTTTPPDFATVIATVLDNAVSGVALINIENNKVIPPAVGWLYDQPAVYDLVDGAAATPLVNWSGSDGVILVEDPVTGELNIPYDGVYRITDTFTATFTADAKSDRTFHLDLYDTANSQLVTSFGFPIPTDFAIITGAITAPIRLDSSVALQLQIRVTGDDVSGVQFQNHSFAVETIQVK